MKAMILAAGKGTRLNKYTEFLPKGMLNFHGKSLIERQINQIIEGDEDTSKYVDELEDSYDAGDYEVASPEDFVKDVENFLRNQD